jgi:catechol 2,3-dioxygenase-like lactoylglutathione lyase family enzyme
VARPSADLAAAKAFYVDALGLTFEGDFENHAGYDGLLLSTGDPGYELELTHRADQGPCRPPCGDHLIVLYFADSAAMQAAAQRVQAHGHGPVAPLNPYWIGKSLTFADPDGWRVVLFDLSTRGPA